MFCLYYHLNLFNMTKHLETHNKPVELAGDVSMGSMGGDLGGTGPIVGK